MRKSQRYTILAGIAAMLAFGFQNCANPKFSEKLADAGSSGAPNDPTNPGDPTDPSNPDGSDGVGTYVSKIKSVVVADISKIDVLVVVDNSGSMAPEQKNMGERFGSFIEKINSLDWQVGVTTTDMFAKDSSDPLAKGKLIKIPGLTNRYFLSQAKESMAQAQTLFSTTVQISTQGSGFEQGIAATYASIERSLNVGSPEKAFFRNDAALAVVVVSDADETGYDENPKNLGPKNVPANLVKMVSDRWPGKPFIFNAIVVQSGDEPCKAGDKNNENEDYGVAYEKLVAMTGGVVGSVCEPDYAEQLGKIGTGLGKVVNSVSLDCAPVDEKNDGAIDLEVTIDGVPTAAFTVSGSLVTFTNALTNGKAEFKYTCFVK